MDPRHRPHQLPQPQHLPPPERGGRRHRVDHPAPVLEHDRRGDRPHRHQVRRLGDVRRGRRGVAAGVSARGRRDRADRADAARQPAPSPRRRPAGRVSGRDGGPPDRRARSGHVPDRDLRAAARAAGAERLRPAHRPPVGADRVAGWLGRRRRDPLRHERGGRSPGRGLARRRRRRRDRGGPRRPGPTAHDRAAGARGRPALHGAGHSHRAGGRDRDRHPAARHWAGGAARRPASGRAGGDRQPRSDEPSVRRPSPDLRSAAAPWPAPGRDRGLAAGGAASGGGAGSGPLPVARRVGPLGVGRRALPDRSRARRGGLGGGRLRARGGGRRPGRGGADVDRRGRSDHGRGPVPARHGGRGRARAAGAGRAARGGGGTGAPSWTAPAGCASSSATASPCAPGRSKRQPWRRRGPSARSSVTAFPTAIATAPSTCAARFACRSTGDSRSSRSPTGSRWSAPP